MTLLVINCLGINSCCKVKVFILKMILCVWNVNVLINKQTKNQEAFCALVENHVFNPGQVAQLGGVLPLCTKVVVG